MWRVPHTGPSRRISKDSQDMRVLGSGLVRALSIYYRHNVSREVIPSKQVCRHQVMKLFSITKKTGNVVPDIRSGVIWISMIYSSVNIYRVSVTCLWVLEIH